MLPADREASENELDGLLPGIEFLFNLAILHGIQDFTENRAGLISERNKIISIEKRRRRLRLRLQFPQFLPAEPEAR